MLLGTTLVTSADAAVIYPLPRKTLDVLAYLLLNRGRTMSRASAAFTLFPDDQEEVARASLRRNLHHLLSALPEPPAAAPFVLADGKTIAWSAKAPAIIDIVEFERAISERRDDDVIALYRGELLPSLHVEWTAAERERLRSEFHDVLLRKILAERSQRRFDEATALARTLLNEDPWREDIVRLLMAIRYETGDRSGALFEYERFASRLRAEMQTEPMPETTAVRESVMRGAFLATSERLGAQPLPATMHSEAGLPFVGRGRPMETALECWHTAANGRGALLFVTGEAGIGKSRFVTELARAIEREGGSVLRGQTSVVVERAPYEAFLDALAQNTPGAADELLGEHAGVSLSDDRSARLRLFEAVRRRLADLAQQRPLALILEDLHWAGPDTVALLDFVALRLNAVPLFVIVTMRTDELSRGHPLRVLGRQLENREVAEVLTLSRLSNPEVEKAITSSLPFNIDASAIARAVEWADGLPLLVMEAAREIASGRPVEHGDIDALVGGRFARLSRAATTALAYAAAIGSTFEVGIMAEAMAWRDASVIDALSDAVELGLVRAAPSGSGIAFAFTHHVLHAASYGRIALQDRVRAHAAIGHAIAALPASEGVRAAEAARHLQSAGETELAARSWCAAARYALSIFANHEARSAASAGLSLVGEHSALRYDLLRVREDAARRVGGLAERRADSLAMLECAGDDAVRKCEALERVFDSHRDEPAMRRDTLEQLAPLTSTCASCATAYERLLGTDAYLRGDYAAARDIALEASLRLERLGDKRASLVARLRYITTLRVLGDFAAVDAAIADVRTIFEKSEDVALAAQFYWIAAIASGDEPLETMLADALHFLELTLRLGDRHGEGAAHHATGILLRKLGRFDEAKAHTTAALEAFRDIGDPEVLDWGLLGLGQWQASVGESEGAIRTLQTLSVGALPSIRVDAMLTRGIAEMQLGRLEDAVTNLSAARQTALDLKLPLHIAEAGASLSVVLWLRSEVVESRRLLEDSFGRLSAMKQRRYSAEFRAFSARLHAEQGDFDKALADAGESLSLMERYTVGYRGQSWWHLAVAYSLAGRDEAAVQFAAKSARAFVEDALQLSAEGAELYSALPWVSEVVAFLFGRGLPNRR
jgi:DNA-binding SARP family transcriptional activator/tetratricopeptide (TPR) repeat protein